MELAISTPRTQTLPCHRRLSHHSVLHKCLSLLHGVHLRRGHSEEADSLIWTGNHLFLILLRGASDAIFGTVVIVGIVSLN